MTDHSTDTEPTPADLYARAVTVSNNARDTYLCAIRQHAAVADLLRRAEATKDECQRVYLAAANTRTAAHKAWLNSETEN